jgi:hypothetical protein
MPDVPYTDELPLNSDPRWTPIDSPFEWLRARLGDGHLAARDLDEELAQDRIRYMIRSIDTGERKLGLAARWAGKLTLRYWDGTPGVSIYYRNTGDPGTRVTGWMLYLWRPDFEAIWPADPNFPMLPAPEVLVPWGSRFRRIRDEMLADSTPPLDWSRMKVVEHEPASNQKWAEGLLDSVEILAATELAPLLNEKC